ncbi:MAG: hypothetical protein SOU51_01190 [Collinsella sp.]|nr:hypothetical protein [Collinsella sp.]
MRTEPIHIAMDPRSGMHSIVRLVPVEELDRPFEPVDPDALNRLLMARNVETLVEAAAQLGTMALSTASDRGMQGKCFKPSELQGNGKRVLELEAPDAERLLEECFFDPYAAREGASGFEFSQTGRVAKAATRRAVETYGFDSARDYSFADDQYRFLVEPIQDWVFARNVLSIILRIGGLLRENPEEQDVLTAAGFSHAVPETAHQRDAMGGSCFVIPIGFNPYFRKDSLLLNDVTFKRSADVIWPLYRSVAGIKKSTLTKQFLNYHLRTEESVVFLTAVEAMQVEGSFQPRDTIPLIAKWWYMGLREQDGCSQRESADMLLRAFDRVLFRPELTYSGEPMREIEPASMPANLLEAMWLLVRDHPGRYLLTCKNCHRTILSGTQGGERRRFCSDSCRVAWNSSASSTRLYPSATSTWTRSLQHSPT